MAERKRKKHNILELNDVIDKALTDDQSVRYGMWSVNAGQIAAKCERKLWYNFRWVKAQRFDAASLKRFSMGNIVEDYIVELLRSAGFEVINENPKAKNERKQYRGEAVGGLLVGYLDGFIRGGVFGDEWHVLEIKSAQSAKYKYADEVNYRNPKQPRCSVKHPTAGGNAPDVRGTFFLMRDKGIESVKPEYYGQVQTYIGFSQDGCFGKEFESVKNGVVVVFNLDTQQLYFERIEGNRVWYKAAIDRSKRLSKNTLPDRKWEVPMYGECKFCDYQKMCHESAPFEHLSCRNCSHVELKTPGQKGYFGNRRAWVCSKFGKSVESNEFAACESHEPIEEDITF